MLISMYLTKQHITEDYIYPIMTKTSNYMVHLLLVSYITYTLNVP